MVTIDNNSHHGKEYMNVQFSKLRNISATANTSINLIVIFIITRLYRLTKQTDSPKM